MRGIRVAAIGMLVWFLMSEIAFSDGRIPDTVYIYGDEYSEPSNLYCDGTKLRLPITETTNCQDDSFKSKRFYSSSIGELCESYVYETHSFVRACERSKDLLRTLKAPLLTSGTIYTHEWDYQCKSSSITINSNTDCETLKIVGLKGLAGSLFIDGKCLKREVFKYPGTEFPIGFGGPLAYPYELCHYIKSRAKTNYAQMYNGPGCQLPDMFVEEKTNCDDFKKKPNWGSGSVRLNGYCFRLLDVLTLKPKKTWAEPCRQIKTLWGSIHSYRKKGESTLDFYE